MRLDVPVETEAVRVRVVKVVALAAESLVIEAHQVVIAAAARATESAGSAGTIDVLRAAGNGVVKLPGAVPVGVILGISTTVNDVAVRG